MPETTNRALLNDLMDQSVREFFESRDFASQGRLALTCLVERAAVIGFSSKDIRGVVGIGMETKTLQRIVAMQPALSGRVPVDDWLGEAANQLLGRFKNKLVRYGAAVSIALPLVLRGMRLEFVSSEATGLWAQIVDSPAGPICLWLDARIADGVVLNLSTDPDAQSAAEGETMLF